MPNLAGSTVTVWSADPAALAAVKAHVAAPAAQSTGHGLRAWLHAVGEQRGRPRVRTTARAFSLEAVVPTGMSLDAWDGDRALELWGTSRPEEHSSLEHESDDRLVYELATAYSHPAEVFRALSAAHPSVVVHAVTTCESEYAAVAWYVRGEALDERELELDLTDEEWEEWDGEWDLPADWSFDAATARRLASG
ncbi:hypothetical protein FHN55_02615 [Streptomyces sp. NP160]|uniref:hypothetical protein n=1 Tax=Streptomyces sp. NP160 TaxID=2586637 RepID=UPI001118F589|nr:hypothetical protein [Streptomyces sp. NP160]TNM69659.1 hypothetical protein FHN55_02615 [Streptomyces sp. NP160]